AQEALIQSSVAIGEFQATHIAIYLTLLFAYIAAAFVAGSRLTRFQAWLTTCIFTAVAAYEVMIIAAVGLASGNATRKVGEFIGEAVTQAPGADTIWPHAILWSCGLFAALSFMWSVRRSKAE
ncbi:MAG: hypothetical protein ACR2QW_07690, partial [bacterium]